MKNYFLILSVIILIMGCSSKNTQFSGSILSKTTSEIQSVDQKEENISKIKEEKKDELDDVLSISKSMIDFETYLPILMFHYIKDVSVDSPDQLGYNLSFSPEKLEEFLLFFQENQIETLTFWDMKDILAGKKEFPKQAVMLTFDDGHIDHYRNAFRLLQKYNMKGVFFIISGKPDNDQNYATWDQIKEMSDAGNEIASHTVSHIDLSTLSKDKLISELELSKKKIEEIIGKPVISFCYPSGKYNAQVLKIVRLYYLFARTTNPGKDFFISNRYELPMVRMFPTTGVASLKLWFKN